MSTTATTNHTTDAVTDALCDMGFDIQSMQIAPGHNGYGAIVICKNAGVAKDVDEELAYEAMMPNATRRVDNIVWVEIEDAR